MKGYKPKHKKDVGLQPYDGKGNAKEGNIFKEKILPRLEIQMLEETIALDVGCGNGRICQVLSESPKVDKVWGIDPYEKLNDKFKSSIYKFENTSFEDFNTGTKFDFILFWGVFYIMPDYVKAFEKAKDLLDSMGTLVIGDDPTRREDRAKHPNAKHRYNLGQISKRSWAKGSR